MIALVRFHIATGVKIALAAAIPLAGAAVVAVGLQQYPGAVIAGIARSLAGTPPTGMALVGLSVLSFGLASWATPRVVLGSNGWIRHLPLSAMQHRVALILGVACAQTPLVVAVVGLAVLESTRAGAIAWRGFVTPPLIAIATASLAMAMRRRRARVRLFRMPAAVPFEFRIALRSLGVRLLSAWLAGAIPLAAAILFVRNNTIAPDQAGLAMRLGGVLAVSFTLAQLADSLATRRPSWPWARSLPVSAAKRVAGDITILSVACAPIVAVVAARDPLAALAVATVMPLLATRATAAMRRDGRARSAAAGPVLIEGAFTAVLVALLPWIALVTLAALPLAFRDAARRERALRVTRWSALHHVAAGDTLSWTA